MGKTLREHFSMIRTKEEVLANIYDMPMVKSLYDAWKPEEREEFLEICTGAKGVKMLYDSFFKEIMNPEYTPDRLNDFLSLLLAQSVQIRSVLPSDSTRIADESSLLIMDILVELEDGSLANIEVQKIGYYFPETRSACYSADLLLRQYKRIRDEKRRLGKQFSYRDIQPVFVIVLFEESPLPFRQFRDVYRHYSGQKSDTGVILKHPQKFVYLALDVFKEKQDNGDGTIHNRLEAWLTFLCRDEPEWILKLIDEYPDFEPLYEDIYELCRNMEKVMGMFSKELMEMDRNTVKLMIDEMQAEIDQLYGEQNRKAEELRKLVKESEEQSRELEARRKESEEQSRELEARRKEFEEQSRELEARRKESEEQSRKLEEQAQEIAQLKKMLAEK